MWMKGWNVVILTGRPLCIEEVVAHRTVDLSRRRPALCCTPRNNVAFRPVLCCRFLGIVAEQPAGSCPSVLAPTGPCLYLKGQQDVLT